MASDTLRLSVRTRRTLKPDWSEEEVELVPCPVTGSSRLLEECRHCVRSEGSSRDSTGRRFVVCRSPAREPPSLPVHTVDPAWEALTVAQVMTEGPLCIHRDVALGQIVALFVEHGISGAPVVDDEGRPIGIVSRGDILMEGYERAEENDAVPWADGPGPNKTAREIMTPRSISISERSTALEAVRLLAAERVHRLPVVDDQGTVVGIVSTLDILTALATHARPR